MLTTRISHDGQEEVIFEPEYRFQNTFDDLLDCTAHMGDKLDGGEVVYREGLIRLCKRIAAVYSEGRKV